MTEARLTLHVYNSGTGFSKLGENYLFAVCDDYDDDFDFLR